MRKFGITVEDYMLPARHQIQMVDPEGRLNPESEQGTEPGHEYPLPADEELLAAYEQLVVGRRSTTRTLAASVPIVIRGPAESVDELRLGFADARHRVLHVSEPVIPAPLDIQSLIAATAGGGARAAAHKLLAPVVAYDSDHNSALLQTLRTYLEHNAQPSDTSRDLYIHRNTLSKRLRLLSELLRLPLDTLDGQATCLMALRITDL